MPLTSIKTSMLDRLAETAGLPAIYYRNIKAPLPTDDHIIPDFLPAETRPIGLATTDQERGLFQVLVAVKKGKGEIESARIAELILAAFPRNLALSGVRIDGPGHIRPSYFNDAWLLTPVMIPYQNIRG